MNIIDLTAQIEEGMVLNFPLLPRAPVIWQVQRHLWSQWWMVNRWDPPRKPELSADLPPEAGMPGQGHGVQTEQVLISTHMGTHIDAGRHFDHRPEAQEAHQIPLERCCGSALLLDLRDVCTDGYAITRADLDRAERQTEDRVHEGDIVALHTGHSARYGYGPGLDREKWAFSAPGLGYDTPAWFIERRVKLVAADTHNLDCDNANTAHINFLLRPWAGQEVIQIVENLVNLEQIAVHRFTFFALPLPIVGGSGSPCRAIAIVD